MAHVKYKILVIVFLEISLEINFCAYMSFKVQNNETHD